VGGGRREAGGGRREAGGGRREAGGHRWKGGGKEVGRLPQLIHLANILVSKNMETKIADFGVAKFISDGSMTAKVGHEGYYAPEMVDESFYNTSVDIWSFGVLIWHMLRISAGLELEKAKEKATKEEFM
jgi:serine/threonine protein kinase